MTTRVVPERTQNKYTAWRLWASRWNWMFLIVGGLQAGLAVLVAANTEKGLFSAPWNWILAVSAAVFSFLVAALGAQAKTAAFETAARELEKAIVAYETDPSMSEQALGIAEQRGIDILNRLK